MVAVIGESARAPGEPRSMDFAAIDTLAALIGALLLVPAAVRVFRARQYIGTALAIVGTPLATLLVGGLIFSVLNGRPPLWQLVGMGTAGIALVVMAIREFRRGAQPVGA